MATRRRAQPRRQDCPRFRLRRFVARWFVVWAVLALAGGGWLLVRANGVDPGRYAGGSPCTGPLGHAFGWGVKVLGVLAAAGLAFSAALHALAGWRYLAARGRLLMQLACWWDVAAWVLATLVLGTGLGPLWVALPLGLALGHVWLACFFVGPVPGERAWNLARPLRRAA